MTIVVKAGPKDNSDSLVKKFQRKVIAEGRIQEIRDKAIHKKRSELRQEYLAEKRRKIMRYRRQGF